MATSAVALLSGGLDSGTAVALWLDRGNTVALALTADYGQRAAVPEERAARALARRFSVEHRTLDLGWLGEFASQSGSALVDGGPSLPDRGGVNTPGDQASAEAVWVPARNVVLLAAAAAAAESVGAEVVLAGFNREEAETFPDNSAAFMAAFDRVLELGTRCGLRVESPTAAMLKSEIVDAARRLNLSTEDFWSCYCEGPERCGRCESCVRSVAAWSQPR